MEVALKLRYVVAEKMLMSILFRVSLLRVVLWWLADHGIFRVPVEEAFKRDLLRRRGLAEAVVLVPRDNAGRDDAQTSRSRRAGG